MGSPAHAAPGVAVHVQVLADTTNGERSRPDVCALQVSPGERHSHWSAREGADRIWRHRRLTIGVTHDVDQQPTSALFLAHLRSSVLWVPAYQFLSHVPCECADFVEIGAPVKWYDDVGSEQASGLNEAHQPKLVEQIAQRKSGRADLGEIVVRRVQVVVRRGQGGDTPVWG